jgi:nicotinate-nucleotide adenylyltransferase
LKKIGLFGGTFNPIHYGHLRSAAEIKEAFGLDKICFIPAAIPPHKKSEEVENAKHRLKMIRIAISRNPDFGVSDIELKRTGPSYTIDTINYFLTSLKNISELFFIIGSDAFLELNTWKSYKALLRLISFIIMARPDTYFNEKNKKTTQIGQFLSAKISTNYIYSEKDAYFKHNEMPSIHIYYVTALDISSTKIRQMVRSGRSVQYLLPDSVEKYIKSKGLYK